MIHHWIKSYRFLHRNSLPRVKYANEDAVHIKYGEGSAKGTPVLVVSKASPKPQNLIACEPRQGEGLTLLGEEST